MARTLSQILIDANAYLDLDATLPTSTELTNRANYANRAVWDASAVAQFSEFKKVYVTPTYTLATISLPSNFREFMAMPHVLNGGAWDPYEEIAPEDIFTKSSGDKYCYVLGNPSEGYFAYFNNLTANATLSIVFQRFPSGLATLTDVCELSDPSYVTTKIESYVLESRNNDRFPIVKAEANTKLQNMIGREMKTLGGGTNGTKRQGSAAYAIGG